MSFNFMAAVTVTLESKKIKSATVSIVYPSICHEVTGSDGEGNGTPLKYSCLENPMGRGAWWAAVHGIAKSQTQLNDFTFTFHFSRIGEGNGNPLQCSCLENPRDGGAWWAAVYGVAQSQTRLKRLSSSSRSSNGIRCYDLSLLNGEF